jgi:hypothetical protein
LVDLLPITRSHYYHPTQHGSWSIKAVLPAMVPELGYDALGGVQNGGQAQEAYLEAVDAATSLSADKPWSSNFCATANWTPTPWCASGSCWPNERTGTSDGEQT